MLIIDLSNNEIATAHSTYKCNLILGAYHEKISQKLKAKIYFCNPYKSWQKGAIENRQ